MRILITGSGGLLGRTLCRHMAGHEVFAVTRRDCDLADAESCQRMVGTLRPDVVLHAAAMTNVDACETEREKARRDNVQASENIAKSCLAAAARLIAFSTDYVFDGELERPYREDDPTDPRTGYGRSKLAAERAVIGHCPNHLICRIAWLYGSGGPSFVHTMLRLGRENGAPVRVVADQIGNPTSADAVADAVALLLRVPAVGVMHLACDGEASWYDFAREIFSRKNLPRDVAPCRTEDFPRPAPRPANSRLENAALARLGLPPMPDWRRALGDFFSRFPEG